MKHFAIILLTVMSITAWGKVRTVVVGNGLGYQRSEVVSFDADEVKGLVKRGRQLVIVDKDGQQIQYQKTHDGKIIFRATVDANSSTTYRLTTGEPKEMTARVFGKLYEDRLDDIAWENDRIAFRTYGPAFAREGNKGYGYDVWVKNVDTLVVDDRYRKMIDRNISYHKDHGNGMDCYSVGPTLGCGTAALMCDGEIVYPGCYSSYEILDEGPIRFTVRLHFAPVKIGDTQVTETRTISLDEGSQLNKTTLRYEGLDNEKTIVAGGVLHSSKKWEEENTQVYETDVEKGYVGLMDPTDGKNNGTIYIGTVFSELDEAKLVEYDRAEAKSRGAKGHVLGFTKYAPGKDFEYYWGAAWSKWGFESLKEWTEYLKRFAECKRNPLTVTIK